MFKRIIDKKLLAILSGFYLIYYFINILQRIYLKYNGYGFRQISWTEALVENTAIEIINTIPLMLIIVYTTRYMLERHYKWVKLVSIQIILSLATAILFSSIYNFYKYLSGSLFYEITLKNLLTSTVRYLNTHFLIYIVTVFIVYTYYYVNRASKIELQQVHLKQQLTDVQMRILKYQLHPHFFFNTLNSISSLIEINTKLAQNMLADFSDLIRDIMFLNDTNTIPLSLELSILKRYIDIMSIRYSDHLKVTYHIDSGLDNYLIPSLILQPIIENSFKYGYSYNNTNLLLDITIKKERDLLQIKIKNDGASLPKKMKLGTGLQNTLERLKTLYKDAYTFTIENNKNGPGVTSFISLPLESSLSVVE